MTRGRTTKGRSRTKARRTAAPSRPLFRGHDHGSPIRITGKQLGIGGDQWIEPFLDANRPMLQRMDIQATVEVRRNVCLSLTPSSRVGAVPLVSPANRRVSAGLLVEPRFRWSALGAVLNSTGFTVEPRLGGGALVPGSAREVPAWLLAAPVIRRLEGYLKHRRRGFTLHREARRSPRGRVDWANWARHEVPAGRWTTLPCEFPEPDDDQELIQAVRWTLGRLDADLANYRAVGAARALRVRIAAMISDVGTGPSSRPTATSAGLGSGWVAGAVEGMTWVSEERGLGGSRVLDGLSWDLEIAAVWESWVLSFVQSLAPSLGFVALDSRQTTRRLHWKPGVRTMGKLVPDSAMRSGNRIVWFDAKYKAHLNLIARSGWNGVSEKVRDSHRADLHQALAYAALEDADAIDSVLVYPQVSRESLPPAVAHVQRGNKAVRLLLLGLPFGFGSEDERQATLANWRTYFGPDG